LQVIKYILPSIYHVQSPRLVEATWSRSLLLLLGMIPAEQGLFFLESRCTCLSGKFRPPILTLFLVPILQTNDYRDDNRWFLKTGTVVALIYGINALVRRYFRLGPGRVTGVCGFRGYTNGLSSNVLISRISQCSPNSSR
jgi:hypothetical protein